MTFQRILLIALLLLSIYFGGKAQCDLSTPPTPTCEGAPFLCLNQLCYMTEDTVNNCCNGWCGINAIINNPQYYAFIPTQECIEFEISVDDCLIGAGLQSGILDACPWDNANVLDCNPGTPPGGTMLLQSCDLVPGLTYYLIIDGSSATVCHYTITSVTGIQSFPLTDSLDLDHSYANDTLVCPGYQDLVLNTGPLISNVIYHWTFGWNGQQYDTDFPTYTMDIEGDAPSGTWDVCVRASNGCDSTNQVCFPITIATTPPVVKEPATFCDEEFPFLWHGQVITGPGNYTATITDEHNCSFDSLWTVQAFPLYSPGIIDTFVCSPQFQLGEFTFDQSGHYTLFLPNATSNGCDSIVELDLTIGASDQFVELVCENDQSSLQVHIIAQDASIDTVIFEWYPCSFDSLLSTETAFFPDTAGCFSLVTQSGVCVDTITSNYLISACDISDSCELLFPYACINDTVLITPEYPIPARASIHWLIDFPGDTNSYSGNTDSIYVTFDAPGVYPVSFTIQDSFQTQTCHTDIEIQSGIEVSICCDETSCDSCVSFSIFNHNGIAGSIAINGGPPFAISGISETQETICFPTSELDTTIIQITGVESVNGCASTIVGDSFITFIPLPRPLVFIVPFTDTLCSFPNDLAAYRWRYCDSTTVLSTSPCFAPPTSGCYCLEVENEFGCTFETCTDFVVSENSIINDRQIKITPNPSNGLIHVEIPLQQAGVNWELADIHGKILRKGIFKEKSNEIFLNSLTAGIYFLKFDFQSQGAVMKKIVIE